MDDKDKLALVDDVFVAEILRARDDEGGAADAAAVDRVRERVAAAKSAVGKRRLQDAKAAVAAARERIRVVSSSGDPRGAAALRSARERDAAFDEKLTLAARNAGANYEADRAGIEEDLADLERWEEGDGSE